MREQQLNTVHCILAARSVSRMGQVVISGLSFSREEEQQKFPCCELWLSRWNGCINLQNPSATTLLDVRTRVPLIFIAVDCWILLEMGFNCPYSFFCDVNLKQNPLLWLQKWYNSKNPRATMLLDVKRRSALVFITVGSCILVEMGFNCTCSTFYDLNITQNPSLWLSNWNGCKTQLLPSC